MAASELTGEIVAALITFAGSGSVSLWIFWRQTKDKVRDQLNRQYERQIAYLEDRIRTLENQLDQRHHRGGRNGSD